jgi:hypothetical protein
MLINNLAKWVSVSNILIFTKPKMNNVIITLSAAYIIILIIIIINNNNK